MKCCSREQPDVAGLQILRGPTQDEVVTVPIRWQLGLVYVGNRLIHTGVTSGPLLGGGPCCSGVTETFSPNRRLPALNSRITTAELLPRRARPSRYQVRKKGNA